MLEEKEGEEGFLSSGDWEDLSMRKNKKFENLKFKFLYKYI